MKKKTLLCADLSPIECVDAIIHAALKQQASDIHCEPLKTSIRVRYRIDGMLYDQGEIPIRCMQNVISRIKLLASIDITKKRIPQDGKVHIKYQGRLIDLRVSTFPSFFGEKIVIRILDTAHQRFKFDMLGMDKSMLTQMKKVLNQPNGFILVTGPTGSGKTTTLHALLSEINSPTKHIMTLENPIEYSIDGITQSEIHPETGFTFATGMRALLRQDPDIIMIGEIRDKETARIATQAALTGHLVLSTMHTNDAVNVIMRLVDMGIEPFLINAALNGILAQRLARKICTLCRTKSAITPEQRLFLQNIGYEKHPLFLYAGQGCDACFHLGLKGRTGIFQFLPLTSQLRAVITPHLSLNLLEEKAVQSGMQSLFLHGMSKVEKGIITLKELMRVTVYQ